MKILLLNPINRTYIIMPSLGLGYLAAILEKKGHCVSLLSCNKEGMTYEDFGSFVQKEHFDLIGFQVYSYDLNSVKMHLEIIRRVSPGTVVIAGGPHPSGDPEHTVSFLSDIDFAFQGESEIGLPMLVTQLEDGLQDYKSIPGLIWRSGNTIHCNHRQVIEDLDTLPMPAWDLIRPESYPEAPHGAFTKMFPTAPIITSRGCPSLCTFCAGSSINGRRVRRRSVSGVIDELQILKSRGIREFHIEDENFTLSNEYVMEFCNRLEESHLNMSWSLPSGVRLDTLNRGMLEAMARAGCYSLAVGIEFGSDRLLQLTRKGLTLKAIVEKMELFVNLKIKVTGFFLLGIPGESFHEMVETTRFSRALPLNRAQFNIFAPFPGSVEWLTLKNRGVLTTIEPDRLYVHDVSYVEGGITRNRLKRLQQSAVLRFYLRPRILFGILTEIRSPRHLKYLILRLIDTIFK